MKLTKKIFFAFIILLTTHQVSYANISTECTKYTDCDMLVACELALQVEKALAGLGANYEGAIANAVTSLSTCSKYPDQFKKDIDITLSETPKVRMTIKWENVRNEISNSPTSNPPELRDNPVDTEPTEILFIL